MSVQKEEYIITGIKLYESFTNDFFRRCETDKGIEAMLWDKKTAESTLSFLADGMSGDYTFFGFIEQISDGYNENTGDIEFEPPTQDEIDDIVNGFRSLFPGITLPRVKQYYVPHYT